MQYAYVPGRWIVFRYNLDKPWTPSGDDPGPAHRELLTRAAAAGRPHWQPFLVGPDGRVDARVNAFFTSRRIRAMSSLTWKKYAHSLALWLNFLLVLGRTWDSATEEDAEYFKEWRLTEEANPRPVRGATFSGDLAALRTFYRWAARTNGVVDPVACSGDLDLQPRGVRDKDIKWLDPAGYRRWRDLGLRGLDTSGRQDRAWLRSQRAA